jgi:hypothetical protein
MDCLVIGYHPKAGTEADPMTRLLFGVNAMPLLDSARVSDLSAKPVSKVAGNSSSVGDVKNRWEFAHIRNFPKTTVVTGMR